MLNISKGKIIRPKKVVIYASEGVGKTTLASQFPEPLFVDTENGTITMDVSRVQKPTSWLELLQIVREVAMNDVCKTFVIDTLDWAEMLAIQDVCTKNRVASIENISYGKGYTYVADCFVDLLKELDKVIDSGKNVVLTAHAKTRKFELPEEMGQYDKYEMKLSRQVTPLIKEWCDMLLFCNYKTFVVTTENNTKKAQGGKRVMYTTHNPCWDAKNRFNLPDEVELAISSIAHLFSEHERKQADTNANVAKERPNITKLKKMLADEGVSEEALQKVVAERGHYAIEATIEDYADEFITRWIIPNWSKIVETIKTNENKGDN